MVSKFTTLIVFAAISAFVLVLALTITRQQNVAASDVDEGAGFEVAFDIDHHPPVHIGHTHDGPLHHTHELHLTNLSHP